MSRHNSVIGLDKLLEERREHHLLENLVHIEISNNSTKNSIGNNESGNVDDWGEGERTGQLIEEVYDGCFDGRIIGSGVSGVVRECMVS